ncbi:MAG: hypothetical protein ABJE10_16565 [bacterium]
MTVEPLYTRPLPGGDSVHVELVRDADIARADHLRGRVVMQRHSAPQSQVDDQRVIVAEVEGDDPNVVVAELFRIARDNAAIARRVLRQQASDRDH